MMIKTALSAALGLCAAVIAGPSVAQSLPDDILHAELREGWRLPGGTQMAALHLTLAPGWKTYWRAPGEGGIPPSFDWAGSENIARVAFHWPKPQVFDINGVRVIGYRDELVLPMEFTAADPSRPMTAAPRSNWASAKRFACRCRFPSARPSTAPRSVTR